MFIRKITKVWQVVIAWRSVAGVMDLAPHQATLPFFDLQINSATRVTINRSCHRTVVVCVSIDHMTCWRSKFGKFWTYARTSHTLHSLHPAPSLSSNAQGLHHPPPLCHRHQPPASPVTNVQLPPTTTAPQQQQQRLDTSMEGHVIQTVTMSSSLSTVLKVSNINSLSLSSFHTKHRRATSSRRWQCLCPDGDNVVVTVHITQGEQHQLSILILFPYKTQGPRHCWWCINQQWMNDVKQRTTRWAIWLPSLLLF